MSSRCNGIETAADVMERTIRAQLPEATYQLAWFDCASDRITTRGEIKRTHWGSIYKLFLVVEVLKMVDEGLLKLDDPISLRREKFTRGIGFLKHITGISTISIEDACRLVFATSDNLCADELFDRVGPERMNRQFQQAGAVDSLISDSLHDLVSMVFDRMPNQPGVDYYHSEAMHAVLVPALERAKVRNHTTAMDVITLMRYAMNGYLNAYGVAKLMEWIQIPNVHTRLDYYTPTAGFHLKGKTGALGLGFFNAEAVAVVEKDSNKVLGYFMVAIETGSDLYFKVNHTIALIGMDLVRTYEKHHGTA